jgi:Ca2+/H+ antiporter
MDKVLTLVGLALVLGSAPFTFRAYSRERRQGRVSASTYRSVFGTLAVLALAASSVLPLDPPANLLLAVIGCGLAFVVVYFTVRDRRERIS